LKKNTTTRRRRMRAFKGWRGGVEG